MGRQNRRYTNIGTTRPGPARPLTEKPQRFAPQQGQRVAAALGNAPPPAVPVAMPVAAREGEEQQQYVSPEPLWISRWQPSKTVPLSKAPWIIAYRWWIQGAVYNELGGRPLNYYRIDLWFKDGHQHYYQVDRSKWLEFRALLTSIGQWLHQNNLGRNWVNGTI